MASPLLALVACTRVAEVSAALAAVQQGAWGPAVLPALTACLDKLHALATPANEAEVTAAQAACITLMGMVCSPRV